MLKGCISLVLFMFLLGLVNNAFFQKQNNDSNDSDFFTILFEEDGADQGDLSDMFRSKEDGFLCFLIFFPDTELTGSQTNNKYKYLQNTSTPFFPSCEILPSLYNLPPPARG